MRGLLENRRGGGGGREDRSMLIQGGIGKGHPLVLTEHPREKAGGGGKKQTHQQPVSYRTWFLQGWGKPIVPWPWNK